jgi:two-component system nitrogen regulation response regulator GlnG
MTAEASMRNAVEAMKRGAYDYLTKPFDLDVIDAIVEKVSRAQEITSQVTLLKDELKDRYQLEKTIIGNSPAMRDIYKTIGKVAPSDITVLVEGESGTGKELIARAIHYNSRRLGKPFIALNCAAIPKELLESELFGFEKGAFTGATDRKLGKFEQANGGTIFLDEIGDMPLDLQARLLRVLDERQVAPLGSEEVHPVDFQLISASHRDLPLLVREGHFREDLYYRLAGIELHLPPLRDRSDKREVVYSVLAAESGGEAKLSAEAERMLLEYAWPGNVRQLRHVLRSAVALADGVAITADHLPAVLSRPQLAPAPAVAAVAAAPAAAQTAAAEDKPHSHLNPIQANERQVLLQMLEQHRWNVSNVAKALDVSRNTLYRKLHKLGIAISHPE